MNAGRAFASLGHDTYVYLTQVFKPGIISLHFFSIPFISKVSVNNHAGSYEFISLSITVYIINIVAYKQLPLSIQSSTVLEK